MENINEVQSDLKEEVMQKLNQIKKPVRSFISHHSGKNALAFLSLASLFAPPMNVPLDDESGLCIPKLDKCLLNKKNRNRRRNQIAKMSRKRNRG